MSDTADRVALEGLRLFVRQIVRDVLAEEHPASPGATDGFVGTAEAARVLGVEQAAIRALVKSERLPAKKLPGVRGWKVRRSDLEAFLAGGQSEGDGPVPDPVNFTARRIAASINKGRGEDQ